MLGFALSVFRSMLDAAVQSVASIRLADGPGASVLLADIGLWAEHLRVVESLKPSTVRKYQRDAADLVRHTRARSWADITDRAVGKWLASHADAQAGSKRRKNLLSCARSLCRWLRNTERVNGDPTADVRVRDRSAKGRGMRPLAIDEARRLLHHVAEGDRTGNKRRTKRLPFYTFLIYTGLRYTEARSVKWRDIDFTRRVLRVRSEVSKCWAEREIILVESVFEVLATIPRGGPNDPVFRRGISHHTVKADVIAAGIDPNRVAFHTFRKTLATGLHEEIGLPMKVIAKQTRHDSIQVLERSYIEPTEGPLGDGMIALEKILRKSLDAARGTGDIQGVDTAHPHITASPDGPSRRSLSAYPPNSGVNNADERRRLAPSVDALSGHGNGAGGNRTPVPKQSARHIHACRW